MKKRTLRFKTKAQPDGTPRAGQRKRPALAWAAIAVFILLTGLNAPAQTWEAVGNAGFSAGTANYTSLQFDNGTPYVAYSDASNIYRATVKKYNGSSWVNVGNAGFSAGTAYYTSLQFDNGTPYVAYRDAANSYSATVMKYNGSSWVIVGNAGFSAGSAYFTSLQFDNGTPYVAYSDGYKSNRVTVKKYNGSSWVDVGNAGFSAGGASYISLQFDNGTPYVAYLDQAKSNKATVMKYNGSSWVNVGSVGFSAGTASYTSLQFDNGTPYVAYADAGNSSKATVMKFDGSSWVNVGNAGFSAGGASYTSLQFDNGTPYVAFQDAGNSSKATVMKFDGSSWVNVGNAGFSAGTAYYTSLQFDNGTPYVAFQDVANNYKATVMKSGSPLPVISSFTPAAAAQGSTITISGENFTGATAVSFGGTAATSFTVVNASTITAVVGAGASGDVSVTTPEGTATKAGFTYVVPPGNLSYAASPITGTYKAAITTAGPTVTGTVDSYSISPALPAGLSLNTTTGEISGTPTTVSVQTDYTVTATNIAGSTTATVRVTVNPKELTVTGAVTANKVYNGNTDAVISGATLTGVEPGDEVSLDNATSGTFAQANVGTNIAVSTALTISGADAGNYTLTQTTGLLADITQKALTVTADDKTKVYDGVVYNSGSFTVSYSGFENGETEAVLGSTLSFTGTATTATNAGTGYVITPQGLTSSNYNITFVNGELDITPKALTVTADAKTKVYGEADPALTYQITAGALIGSDALTGSLSRAAGEDVGDYAISSTLANTNYTITFDPADLSITEKAITVTADAKTKVYGETDPALTYQITAGALVGTDALTGSLSRAAGEDVGTYAISSSLANTNYTITFDPADLSITEKAITVTADDKTKVYGETDPALTYQITAGALVGTDALTGSLSRAAGEDVGTYAISSSLANTNYTITFDPADLSITEKAITVTADAKTKVYGETDPALTYQITAGALVGTDALTGSLSRAAGEDVGTYAISSSLANTNYTITFEPADLSITPKALTVTADAKTKVYGEADPALTYQITAGALVGTDALTGSLSRAAGEDVGTYAISSSLANTNYTITFEPADLSITPKAITVTADAKTKVYGETDPALTYQITAGALVGTDALTGSLSRAAGEDVGTYAISSSLANTNYTITFDPADLSITEKAITVTADAKTKVYGETDPALTYQITAGALVGTDALTGSLSRAAGEDVGTYAISSSLANTNYTITFDPADLSITEKAITVTADDKTKVYGETDPALTYQITAGALVGTDALTGSLSRAAGEDVGTYAISSSLANTNYTITFDPADLSITEKAITVTADAKTKVYGETDPALTYQITAGALVGTDALTGSLSRAAGEDVGTYAISSSLANTNYTITFDPADLSITEKAITVTADAKTKVYGETDPALTYQITAGALVGTDALTGSLSRAAGEDVGTYAISSSLANTNYTITFDPADLSITEKAITVTADAKTKVYGETDPALTYQITAGALVGTDALTGSLSRAAGEDVGTYAISSSLANTNYTITFDPADLSITEKAITVTAEDKTKVYGETDPALTYQITAGALVGTDALTGSLSRAAGEDVGTYAISSSLANTNYTITFDPADLSITKKAITVTAEDKTKVYDGSVYSPFTVSYSGFENGETEAALGGTLSFTGTATTATDVNTYVITPQGLTSSNYDITFVDGALDIVPYIVGDTNGDGTITDPEVAGDTNGDGTITDPEVAGDTNGDGTITDPEIAGDTNGDGTITDPEIAGDTNGDGTITDPEVAGDTNGDGTITDPEIAGDTNGDGTITDPEIAGDTNGDGTITDPEIAGDTNGDGTITDPEIAGDTNGDGTITDPEIAGDTNGDGTITDPEIAGDTNGDGQITEPEILGDANGDGQIGSGEVSGDSNGDGTIGDGETAGNTGNGGSTIAGDTNGDGTITDPEVAGDTNGDGTITDPEIAGDTNGDGTITDPEIAGDTNGDGQITEPEILGDANGDGQIGSGEVSGDSNGDGTIGDGETAGNTGNGGSTIAGDTNGDGTITDPEVAGDTNGDGTITDPEIAGDTNGDGTITDPEIAGDTNGDGTITDPEIAGDTNGDGTITDPEIAGDTNGDGTITDPEIAGDTNGDGTITDPEIAGDTNGDGTITDPEIAGDTNGDGTITDPEIAGDTNGDGTITDPEIAGDTNGDGTITDPEIAGDTNGDGTITDPEIAGDTNGDGTITDPEIAGDTNGDGTITDPEIAGDTNGDGTITDPEIAGDTNGDGTITDPEIAGDTNGDGQIGDSERTGDVNGDGQITAPEIAGDADGNGVINNSEIAEGTIANISILSIEESTYKNPDSEIYYLIDCGDESTQVAVTFTPDAYATSPHVREFNMDIPGPGLYTEEINVVSEDSTNTRTYRIVVEKRFNYEDIVIQKYNNVLLVNNNPETNGGYRFTSFNWYKDGELIGTGQYYSVGDNTADQLDLNAMYSVEIETEDGDVLRTCEFMASYSNVFSLNVAPNPVVSGSTIDVTTTYTTDMLADLKITVSSLYGAVVMKEISGTNNSRIILPSSLTPGIYVVTTKAGGVQLSTKIVVQ